MLWFPVIAAGAAAVLLGKALARHFNGELAQCAVEDPRGVRTLVRFDSAAPREVMKRVATAIETMLAEPIELTRDAVRTGETDIVRLAGEAGTYTLTLTRAWSGPQLGGRAVELLEHLHAVLAGDPAVTGLAWFARQDRALEDAHTYPFDP
jgi:hypothetical protein